MSTHNTREGIEEVTHKVLANMELVLMKKLDGSDIAEIWEILKPTIEHIVHQELQKARHDWLREEIVKLEGMKKSRLNVNFIEDSYIYEYNQALQTIIDRSQSELEYRINKEV
jgi:hypothetical protein